MDLKTMGYEGLDLLTFFEILKQNKVETLVDIRELPISRKKGFSKGALSEAANKNNIQYVHIKPLGSPRKVRHDYRDDGDWIRFAERYIDYLETQEESIYQLLELVRNTTCCLLCFEAEADKCHRYFVAEKIARIIGHDLSVTHLEAKAIGIAAWPELLEDKSTQQLAIGLAACAYSPSER